MSQAALTTVWEFYDAERHAGQGGNYIFLLKAFQNAPYYSGEAQNFADRFTKNSRSHNKLFASGGRTFMRRPYMAESEDRTHKGFAARWQHYKRQSPEEQKRLVWVPNGSPQDQALGEEGATFWANEITLLVSLKNEDRRAVESRVQLDIMNYYDGLVADLIDWYIPKQSRLAGHGPSVASGPALLYSHEGGRATGAEAFFSGLMTVDVGFN